MKQQLRKFLKLNYPVRIKRKSDGMYCAEVVDIEGLCAYGRTPMMAPEELDEVKEAAFELFYSQGQEPPLPS